MKGIRFLSLGLMVLMMLLGACAQSRRSHLVGQATDEVWAPVTLNLNEAGSLYGNGQQASYGNSGALGSFDLQLNISKNKADFAPRNLQFNPNEVPYRILARRSGDSHFVVLKDNVTVGVGGRLEIFAAKGHYIEEYETWRIELVVNFDKNNYEVAAPAGMGLVVVQQTVDYPELYANSAPGSQRNFSFANSRQTR